MEENEPRTCIKCDSYDFEEYELSTIHNYAEAYLLCNNCGFKWSHVYRFIEVYIPEEDN
ncbi:hypothetical protein MA785_000850 [Vibrio parahaemolyticus]|nr:hypothetical protein [Vibrio parahaemolyticus]EJR2787959.1 hypothetical protein [Vibrio parahaemolyticus]